MALSEMVCVLVFLPLFTAALTGLTVRRISDKQAQFITCSGLVISCLLSWTVFSAVALGGADVHVTLGTWIASGDFALNWALKVDPLTAVMLIVVTTVSAVVHIYSVGYMSHDKHKPRFMCYLSLFTFSMLMLVTADNFIQLFFGWEGVGLCSYLLIGFWFHKDSANAASMKAFIVNRVGDFGFALGIMAVFATFGSVQFAEVFAQVPAMAENYGLFWGVEANIMDAICLLLFVGAMGKSAQLLLHTWLPDAMEGPTPVSALIHAATMVTAGVFMCARISPMLEYAPNALLVITIVGALTAFFAATVGMVQNDIKRVIAYSTCSQLGYMFFACGVSAYAAGVFHLMTHAFFKALLFLCAGSVIHALSDEQDMRKMGGVWKKIPWTYGLMWIGSLALAGLPFFAGFYSKDMVLEAAYADHTTHGEVAYWLGIGAAVLTAFYSWRLLYLTFHGKPRASESVMSHIHESPPIMLVPLIPLAIGALISGYVGYAMWGMVDADGDFWRGAIFVLEENNTLEAAHHVPWWVAKMPIFVGLFGIAVASILYLWKTSLPKKIAAAFRPLYLLFLNKWYFDELYQATFIRGSLALGRFFWKRGDEYVIDGFGPNGMAEFSQKCGAALKRFQSGYLYHYAFVMLVGIVGFVTYIMIRALG
jgi:NADH-quinone oxidoreductase subunit L